jgi:hypothetical protein
MTGAARKGGSGRMVSRQQSGGVTHHLFGAGAVRTQARGGLWLLRNEGCMRAVGTQGK